MEKIKKVVFWLGSIVGLGITTYTIDPSRSLEFLLGLSIFLLCYAELKEIEKDNIINAFFDFIEELDTSDENNTTDKEDK